MKRFFSLMVLVAAVRCVNAQSVSTQVLGPMGHIKNVLQNTSKFVDSLKISGGVVQGRVNGAWVNMYTVPSGVSIDSLRMNGGTIQGRINNNWVNQFVVPAYRLGIEDNQCGVVRTLYIQNGENFKFQSAAGATGFAYDGFNTLAYGSNNESNFYTSIDVKKEQTDIVGQYYLGHFFTHLKLKPKSVSIYSTGGNSNLPLGSGIYLDSGKLSITNLPFGTGNRTIKTDINGVLFVDTTTTVTGGTAFDSNLLNLQTRFNGKVDVGAINWNTLTGKPNFAAVATSGSYNDLINKPTIPFVPSFPLANNQLQNYSIMINSTVVPLGGSINIGGGGTIQVNIDWDATSGVSQLLHKPILPVLKPIDAKTDSGVYSVQNQKQFSDHKTLLVSNADTVAFFSDSYGNFMDSTVTNYLNAKGVVKAVVPGGSVFATYDELIRRKNEFKAAKIGFILDGINDVTQCGDKYNYTGVRNVSSIFKSLIAEWFLDTAYAANNTGKVTKTGTWTTGFADDSAALKSQYINGHSLMSTGNNATLSYTFTGTQVVVGFGTSVNWLVQQGDFYVTIDGTFYGKYNFDNYNMYHGGATNNPKIALNLYGTTCLYFNGLTHGTHTINIINGAGGNAVVVDYFGHLVDKINARPLVVGGVVHYYDIKYHYVDSVFNELVNDNVIDKYNAAIDSVVQDFAEYPVTYVNINKFFNMSSDSTTDGFHPSKKGAKHIANGWLSKLNYVKPVTIVNTGGGSGGRFGLEDNLENTTDRSISFNSGKGINMIGNGDTTYQSLLFGKDGISAYAVPFVNGKYNYLNIPNTGSPFVLQHGEYLGNGNGGIVFVKKISLEADANKLYTTQLYNSGNSTDSILVAAHNYFKTSVLNIGAANSRKVIQYLDGSYGIDTTASGGGGGAIPAKFNPIAGSNITLSGTYPNITFNASGGGGTSTTIGTTNYLQKVTGANTLGNSLFSESGNVGSYTGKFVAGDPTGSPTAATTHEFYYRGDTYGTDGLLLKNTSSGTALRLHVLGTNAYFTNEAGAGIGITISNIQNPNDGSLLVNGVNKWAFTGGNVSFGGDFYGTALVHLNKSTGYNQLRLEKPYTPQVGQDVNGNIGDVVWDASGAYVKTSNSDTKNFKQMPYTYGGTETLVNGSAVVSCPYVTGASIIQLTWNSPNGTPTILYAPISNFIMGTSFTVKAGNGSSGTFYWTLVNLNISQ